MTTAATLRRRFFAPLREGIEPGARWVEYVARTGYLAIGVVYGLVGVLSVFAAFSAARSGGTRDALATIRAAPFGRLLLAAVALGLLCYAAWRVVQAWRDTERKGRDLKGVAVRLGFAFSGLAYLALGVSAGMAAVRGGTLRESDNSEQAAEVLAWPGGWFILIVIGLVVAGVGIAHFRRAYVADFMHEYDYTDMSDAERDWARPIGRFGLAARGVTFCLIGLFVAVAGWRTNAQEVGGLRDAFNVVARQPYGQVLLAVLAAGFVAYGVFCLSQAKYRRIAKV